MTPSRLICSATMSFRISAELLGQSDDDALRATDVAQAVLVLVLHQLADEFGGVILQAGKYLLDVFNGEHDATYAERVRRCVSRLRADRHRLVEFHELKAAVAVRGPHHRNVDSGAVESDDTIHPTSLDCHLALQLQ